MMVAAKHQYIKQINKAPFRCFIFNFRTL